jgi:hypothetical protein
MPLFRIRKAELQGQSEDVLIDLSDISYIRGHDAFRGNLEVVLKGGHKLALIPNDLAGFLAKIEGAS